MLRLRTISLAAALVACRAATPTVAVRAPLAPPATAPVAEAPAGAEPAVGAGSAFVCELRRDGAVWCRGDNSAGALGDGTNEWRIEARRVPDLEDVVQLTVASNTACAVTRAGRVFRWGVPVDRRAPRSPVRSPEALDFGAPVAEVVVTRADVCARLVRGGVVCRGASSPDGGPTELSPLRDAGPRNALRRRRIRTVGGASPRGPERAVEEAAGHAGGTREPRRGGSRVASGVPAGPVEETPGYPQATQERHRGRDPPWSGWRRASSVTPPATPPPAAS